MKCLKLTKNILNSQDAIFIGVTLLLKNEKLTVKQIEKIKWYGQVNHSTFDIELLRLTPPNYGHTTLLHLPG